MLTPKTVVLILFLFITQYLYSNDSLRIITFPKQLHLHVRLNSAQSQLEIRNPEIEESLRLSLNTPSSLKVGFFYSWLGLSYGFILPREKKDVDQYGKSKGFSLDAHVMKTRLMIDVMYKKYHGYFLTNPEEFISDWDSESIYPQMPDLHTIILSLSVGYVFRPDKFSPTAAYTFTKAMRKSGGSWIVGGFASRSLINSDSSLVSKAILQWVDPKLDLKGVTFIDIGASFGYAFLVTIMKKNFFSLSLLPGLTYQNIKQQLAKDFTYKHLDALSLRTAVHFSLGRNGNKFYWGVNSFLESGITRNFDTELSLNSGYLEFFLGYRLNTENWKFMRKIDKIMNPKFSIFQKK